MHDTAYEIGGAFFQIYGNKSSGKILDIGSRNVNGSLRDWCPDGYEYIGLDLTEGPGVDVVLDDPHRLPFENETFDLVVSTSCLEHDQMFWLTFLEMLRCLKPGGQIYINAPSGGMYHSHPFDYWRFYPDAGIALESWGRKNGLNVKLIESFIARRGKNSSWNDCVMVFHLGIEFEEKNRYLSDIYSNCYNIRTSGSASIKNYEKMTEGEIKLSSFKQTNMLLDSKIISLQNSLDLHCQKNEEEKRILTVSLEHQKELAENLQKQLADVYDSTSWRIAAPLRSASQRLKRGFTSLCRTLKIK